ncbi:hypothetical protein FQA47_008074 [Oryzias melastigma]|uniref:Uncharacterized protein n=1 Tax=Oryzias melastigma TaxID=30732 RepID=A0A834FGC1_ORYME|nr:hypothetical protein FQA47_008074 [Oryzias melastigma]
MSADCNQLSASCTCRCPDPLICAAAAGRRTRQAGEQKRGHFLLPPSSRGVTAGLTSLPISSGMNHRFLRAL